MYTVQSMISHFGEEDSMDLLEEIACNFSQPHTFFTSNLASLRYKGKVMISTAN